MSEQALNDITVLDISRGRAGAYCTKLFAGFGAEVITLEPPDGDPMRRQGPYLSTPGAARESIPFLWLNTGKKSVTLSGNHDERRATFQRLLESADVLVHSGNPGDFGTTAGVIAGRFPHMVIGAATPFGLTGPYRDFEAEEITLYAMSGGMHLTGTTDREPLGPGVPVCQHTAGMALYSGILLALLERSRSGAGQEVDVSIHEVGIDNVELSLINHIHRGDNPVRKRHPMVPWGLYRSADGYVNVTCGPFRHWTHGCEVFEDPRLLDPKYRHIRDRAQVPEEIDALVEPWLKARTRHEAFEAGQARKLAWGYVCSLEEACASVQLRDRNFFVRVDDPDRGDHEYPGAPFLLDGTPWASSRAPLAGQHNGTGFEREPKGEQTAPCATGTPGDLPLSGIRVLDLTQSWAAPHGTRLLADYGAEVIRIEYPKLLCMLRGGNTKDKMYNKHPMWLQVNRGKTCITMDLRDPSDLNAFRNLIRISDVVIDNSRGGVMDSLGLGIEEQRALNPAIISVSTSAFGRTGPHARYAGYGAVMEALGGIQILTGYSADEPPARIKEVDIVNGVAGAAATLTALYARGRTGRGQAVDLSQLESAIHVLSAENLLEHIMTSDDVRAVGNRHRQFAPQGCYACRGDDSWAVITIRTDEEWARLCNSLGRPDLVGDARFGDVDGRRTHHDMIDQIIGEWTRDRTKDEVMHTLQDVGVPAGAVLTIDELIKDPHLEERGYYVRTDDCEHPFPGPPIRLSRTPGKVRWAGPPLGYHNEYVRCELLGEPAEVIHPIRDEDLVMAFDP